MNTRLTLLLISLTSLPLLAAANEQDEWGDDYATGAKLHNQARLGESADSFERSFSHKKYSKESDAYTAQIRAEMVNKAKQLDLERKALNANAKMPGQALSITRIDPTHLQIVLQAKYLFDENSTSFKSGSLDVIRQLSTILQANKNNRIDLQFVDELDATDASAVNAERSLLVFSLLRFQMLADQNG